MSKQEDCEHIIELGDRAVYVKPECPSKYAHTIKGKRVVAVDECERCRREKEMAASLKKAQADNEDLRKRLAKALRAADEAEEKATAISSVPPEPLVDIRGGIKKWLIDWVSTTKGIGNATIDKLHRVLERTPDAVLELMFKEG